MNRVLLHLPYLTFISLATIFDISLSLADIPKPQADRSEWKVRNAKQAVAAVADWLGTLPTTADETPASLIVLEDDDIPYLRDQIVDRPVWQIVVAGWRNDRQHKNQEISDRYTRTLDVYIDPVTGGLLRIRSRWPVGEPQMPPTVSSVVGTEQLRSSGKEVYHGFPKERPQINFRDALKAGVWGVTTAKQIVAECVIHSQMDRDPKTVWAIMVRGVPPIKPPPGTPRNALDQYRHIIDANSGEWLSTNNQPRYETPHSEQRANWKLRDAETTIAGARTILGSPIAAALPAVARIVTLDDDRTPFLSQEMINRSIWRVSVGRWRIAFADELDTRDPFLRIMDVYLDPLDGKVLKLESRWPKDEAPIAARPTAKSAALQMRSHGAEVYHGFPTDPPEVSFQIALRVVREKVGSDLFAARQVIGHRVSWTMGGKYDQPRDVWAITLRGVPEKSSAGTQSMAAQRSERHIIDASSGEHLLQSDVPEPDCVDPEPVEEIFDEPRPFGRHQRFPGATVSSLNSALKGPYTVVVSEHIGKHGRTTIRWYHEDGTLRRELSSQNLSANLGFASNYLDGDTTHYGIHEDWELKLDKNAGPPGFIDCTPDSQVFIHQFHPQEGQLAIEVYLLGNPVGTVGPLPGYGRVKLTREGNIGLLIRKSQEEPTHVLVIDRHAKIHFEVECDNRVMNPAVTPNADGVLIQENKGEVAPKFIFYDQSGVSRSLRISPNPRLLGWVPGTHKALFNTSVGYADRHRLIDWDTGETLWDIPSPCEDEIPVARSIVVRRDYVLSAGAENFGQGDQMIRMPTVYAFDTESGRLVSEWRPGFMTIISLDGGSLLELGDKVYHCSTEHLSEINFDAIATHTNGWR